MTQSKINFQVDHQDMQALYIASFNVSKSMSFESFKKNCQSAYTKYISKNPGEKTYSQWINKQVIYLTQF